MNRSEHMAWCKERALECIDRGCIDEAYMSMCSDLQKHDETANHIAIEMGMLQIMGGMLKSAHDMRNFIEGFN